MPAPEQRPGSPLPTSPQAEPVSFPATVTDPAGEFSVHVFQKPLKPNDPAALRVDVEHQGVRIFSAAVTPDNTVRFIAGGLRIVFDAASHEQTNGGTKAQPGTETPASLPDAPRTEETEQTVQLWGNIGTDITPGTSPSGVAMASFQFGEHPVLFTKSHYNNQPEEEKPHMSEKNTAWRSVIAFGDRVALLEGATKKQPYILTCLPRTWTEKNNGGKEKTVNGFHLLNMEPVTKRSQAKMPPGQKPLL